MKSRIYVGQATVPCVAFNWNAWKKHKWIEKHIRRWWHWLANPYYSSSQRLVEFETDDIKELLREMIYSAKRRGMTPALILIPWDHYGVLIDQFPVEMRPIPSWSMRCYGVAVTLTDSVSEPLLLTRDDLPDTEGGKR